MLKLSFIIIISTVLSGCAGYVKHYNAAVNAPKTPHQYANEAYWNVLSRGGGHQMASQIYAQTYQQMLMVCSQSQNRCK